MRMYCYKLKEPSGGTMIHINISFIGHQYTKSFPRSYENTAKAMMCELSLRTSIAAAHHPRLIAKVIFAARSSGGKAGGKDAGGGKAGGSNAGGGKAAGGGKVGGKAAGGGTALAAKMPVAAKLAAKLAAKMPLAAKLAAKMPVAAKSAAGGKAWRQSLMAWLGFAGAN